MIKKQFFTTFLAVLLVALLVGQVFSKPNKVAHAQASTPISFDNMTQLSPNGQKVVYVTAQNLNMVGSTIWVANADGSQSTVLVTGDSAGDAYWVTNPIWSPDGQQIAYVKAVKNNAATDFVAYKYEIWAIQSNGSNNRLLTNTLFSPFLGYGGQTDLVWNASNEIEFPGIAKSSYAVNATTLAVRQISNPNSGALPNAASISGVPAYSKTDSRWANDRINPGTACTLKIGTDGGAITATAMILDYEIDELIRPDTVNKRMKGSGFATGEFICWINWDHLPTAFPEIKVYSRSWGPALSFDEVRRYIAGGVPLILWYWETYPTVKRWLVVTGYDGNNITAIDSVNGASVSGDFYSFGFQGAVMLQQDQFFSKVSPENASGPTLDREAITLEWAPMLPTPTSYRYCVYIEGTVGQCAANSSWIDVGLNTQVTLPSALEDEVTYRWQVQAVTGSGQIGANAGEFWEFTPGIVYPPTEITFSGSTELGDVTVTYTNSSNGESTITSASGGSYSFSVPSDSFGTITPSKTCYSFTPNARDYDTNSAPPQTTGFDFTPNLNTFSIAGYYGTGKGTFDYTINNVKQQPPVTADSSGAYIIPNLPCGSNITITPSKPNYQFSPASKTYNNISSNQTGQNYAASVKISGNAGVGNAILSYSGKTAFADTNGDYDFYVPVGWTGRVTPSLTTAGYIFTPESRNYPDGVNTPQIGQNYTAQVMVAGNADKVSNTILSYSINGATQTAFTGANGNYTFYVPVGWTGKVTPSVTNPSTGYTFSPAFYDYFTPVNTPQTGKNYIARVLVDGDISGITGPIGGGVNYTNSIYGQVSEARFGIFPNYPGHYDFFAPYNSTGTITPDDACLTFSPTSAPYTGVLGQHILFTATEKPLPIMNGYMKIPNSTNNAALEGVTLTYTNASDGAVVGVAQTNVNGYYVSNLGTLPCDWTGTVTPSKPGYIFSPASKDYTNITTSQYLQNYDVSMEISGNVGTSGVTMSGVTGVSVDQNGDYRLILPYGSPSNITITPTKLGYVFTPASRTYPDINANGSETNQDYTATATEYTYTGYSIDSQDGFITESTETSGVGGSINPDAVIIRLGDDVSKRQMRSILSFGTLSLPDNIDILTATITIKQNGILAGDPFGSLGSIWVDIRTGVFGAAALEASDFSATATANAVGFFGPASAPTGGYRTATLNLAAKNAINRLGGTQFRLRFGVDDDNDSTADYVNYLSGDYDDPLNPAKADQPKLVITYTYK